jgi:hypothetical protein
LLRALDRALDVLGLRKSVIQFGLAAWILFDYSDGRRESDEAVRYMKALDLPSDLASTWRITESATRHDKWEDLDWRSWELGVKDEGEAHFIEFNSYLYLSFLLQALRLIAKGDASSLPDAEEFRHLAAADGQLMQQLDDIERKPEKWRPFIDEAAIAAVPKLRNRLQEAFVGNSFVLRTCQGIRTYFKRSSPSQLRSSMRPKL